MKFYGQLEKAQIECLTNANTPASPETARLFFDTDKSKVRLYRGAAWIALDDRRVTSLTSDPNPVDLLDDVLLCDASGGSFTATLPSASNNDGKRFIFKKTDSSTNTVTIDGSGAQTIDAQATFLLRSQNDAVEIVCDGSNWRIANRSTSEVATIATTDTLRLDHEIVIVTSSGGAYTLTLPAAQRGKKYFIKKTSNDTNKITVTPTAGTIDGQSTWPLVHRYSFLELVSDGTDWHIIKDGFRGNAEVLRTDNGAGGPFGAVSTFVRIFDTPVRNTIGDFLTVASDGNAGTTFTITVPGFYQIVYNDENTANNFLFYITKNQATLTAAPLEAEILASAQAAAGNFNYPAVFVGWLDAGDIIRGSASNIAGFTTTSDARMYIRRLAG